MNKFSVKTTLASLMLISAGAVMADAPTAELKVAGKVAVPGCTIAQSAGGTYDYGSISPTLVKASATTALTAQTQTWTVTCDAQTFLSFRVIDNQSASTAGSATTQFGLGNVNNTGKIGYYTVQLGKAMVDNATAYTYAATPGSTTVTSAATASVNTSLAHGWAATNGAGAVQKAGQVFAMDMTVTPTLASSATMGGPITDKVPLDGSLTINYSFGL
jgi:hypothetical protein